MNRRQIATAALLLLLGCFLAGCKPAAAMPKGGWEDTPTGRCYRDSDGIPVTGWQDIQGVRYFFEESGTLASGWVELPEGTYCFRQDGTPLTGWTERDGIRCYLKEDGQLARGWCKIAGAMQFFYGDGSVASGWLELDDGSFYLDENGCMVVGPMELEGRHYLFQPDGRMHIGWLQTQQGSSFYHLDGTRAEGWTDVEQQKYFFDEEGYLVTGWVELGEYRYYFLEDGRPAQGPVEIDGQTYHFTPEGIQVWLVNPWNMLPDNYQVELVVAEGGYRVAKSCYDALNRMLADCRAAGLAPILYSGYRTYWDQMALYQAMVADMGSAAAASTVVAVPNTSEHQLGFAVDIVAENHRKMNNTQSRTEVQQWLMEHCWEYGFILRYPEGTTDITGIIYEPWHYRYVGEYLAKQLQENGLTLEEYLA